MRYIGMAFESRQVFISDDDRQLRDEVMTLYLAGHETTASLLAWSVSQLARHPEVNQRLVEELSGAGLEDPPDMDQLKGLTYLSKVIDETLRLYPPAWTVARNAVGEDRLLGRRVSAAAIVMVSPYFTHRLEAFWPDPSRFNPERFAPEVLLCLSYCFLRKRDRSPFPLHPLRAPTTRTAVTL